MYLYLNATFYECAPVKSDEKYPVPGAAFSALELRSRYGTGLAVNGGTSGVGIGTTNAGNGTMTRAGMAHKRASSALDYLSR